MIFPDARLIQFARYPEAGRVKTRLAPALSERQILRLYRQLVGATSTVLWESRLAPVALWYSGDRCRSEDDAFFRSLSAHSFVRQPPGDLGARMSHAFHRTLVPDGEARVALLVGSDCPFLDAGLLREALQVLTKGVDVVLGPAEDGGYYLVGLRQPEPALFRGIHWGGPRVLDQTLDRLDSLGLDFHLLKQLPDIDVPGDIPKLTIKSEYAWIKMPKKS